MACPSPGPSTEGVLPENWVNEYLLTFLIQGQAQETLWILGVHVTLTLGLSFRI